MSNVPCSHRMGGDALSVCLNSVAIVFILEIDNAIFTLGIAERLRARVETNGRVQLSEEEAEMFARTKPLHVCLVVAYLVGSAVAVSELFESVGTSVLLLATFAFGPHAPFWIGALAEAAWGKRKKFVAMATATGSWILGSVLPLVFILL